MTEPTVHHDGGAIPLRSGETVLDALLRSDVSVDHACRSGSCHRCLLYAVNPPAHAQVGLTQPRCVQGAFLACQARPTHDLKLVDRAPEGQLAQVVSNERLTPTIARIRLRTDPPLDYRPGQFVLVSAPCGTTRSYSLASVTQEPWLELHVQRVPNGTVSSWLLTVAAGDRIPLKGPHGACFYVEGNPSQPLLLAGSGTGLAPLYGIARDARTRGHHGPIALLHGGRSADQLYLGTELAALGPSHGVDVRRGGRDTDLQDVESQSLDELVEAAVGDSSDLRAYLCGGPATVARLRRTLFLRGVPSADILADPFTPAPRPVHSPSDT